MTLCYKSIGWKCQVVIILYCPFLLWLAATDSLNPASFLNCWIYRVAIVSYCIPPFCTIADYASSQLFSGARLGLFLNYFNYPKLLQLKHILKISALQTPFLSQGQNGVTDFSGNVKWDLLDTHHEEDRERTLEFVSLIQIFPVTALKSLFWLGEHFFPWSGPLFSFLPSSVISSSHHFSVHL